MLIAKAEIVCASSYDTYVWLVRVSTIISTGRGVIRGHKGRAISRFISGWGLLWDSVISDLKL